MGHQVGVAAVELREQRVAAVGDRLHRGVGRVGAARAVGVELGEHHGPLLLDLPDAVLAHRLRAAGQLLLDHDDLLDGGLEAGAQVRPGRELLLDLGQPPLERRPHVARRERAGDVLEPQPGAAQGGHPLQARDVVSRVEPVTRLRAGAGAHEAGGVVVMQGADGEPGGPGRLADPELLVLGHDGRDGRP